MTTLEQWWEEDAERLNAMAKAARQHAAKVSLPKKKAVKGMEKMKYKYVYHDGVVLRLAPRQPLPEIWVGGEWKPFPEEKDGDIRHSSVAAWYGGTPLTEEQALAKIKELG